jgi:N-acetylglucosaminyldiphosphoundecaprenol N-acetyl-beta-D-mannosaminyltransferase
MSRIEILGVPIDCMSTREALKEIASLFTREGQCHIATPNPEMLVEAKRNPAFREVLQKTSLNLPDGVGLVWAIARRSATCSTPGTGVRPERITGTDTLQALCSSELRICPPERVFLLGAAPGIAEKAAEVLHKKNPHLQIVGTYAGSPREEEEEEIIRRINEACPTLLFVAYGAPAQDLWIARNLPKLRTVKVAMGVGGAFDFIAGKKKRAPAFLRKMGLEWLWRLLLEPRRFRRIWRAVVVFPWMVFTSPSPEPSSPVSH